MLYDEPLKEFKKYSNDFKVDDYFCNFLTQLNSYQVFTVQYSDLKDVNNSKVDWWNNLFYLSDRQTNFKNYDADKQAQMIKIIACILDDLSESN